jgi:hypothetical protein
LNKLKINVAVRAILDWMVATDGIDCFSRNGFASGELDSRVVLRVFLLDALL